MPELDEGEPLYHCFQKHQFLALIPLLAFLRDLGCDRGWQAPPLQACFMFDDPNLHWQTYGFINYPALAKHAELHNYHAAFATIPLDGWFVHQPTAELFAKYPHRISLLMHGNNHITEELARRIPHDERTRMLRQALARTERLENRAKVPIARVMAPPHEACSEAALNAMASLGYEGACVSKGALEYHNKNANWVRTLGMSPIDTICGLAVFPRFRISKHYQNSVLIAALLQQPIILVGHHQDVADNMELLAEIAHFVNSLGNVKWSNMADIARTHFATMIANDTLRVRMYSKTITIVIPSKVNYLVVEKPSLRDRPEALLVNSNGNFSCSGDQFGFNEPLAVEPGQLVQITAFVQDNFKDDHPAPLKKFTLWPGVRRLITEGRDRLAPTLKRFALKSSSSH